MATLALHLPGRVFRFACSIHEDNVAAVAAALERQLPAIAAQYGRVGVVVENDRMAHIITTRRAACRS